MKKLILIFVVTTFFIFLSSHVVKAGWDIKEVGNCGAVANYVSSLALDSANNPHISYFDSFNLIYASSYNKGNSWDTESVDSMIAFSSLALDSANNPHISYQDLSGFPKYALYREGIWHILNLPPYISGGLYISLALDSADLAHISCQVVPPILYYVYLDPATGGWVYDLPTLYPAVSDGFYSSLALDSNDNPHFSHSEASGSSFNLKHTYRNGSGWVHELVASSAGGGSLALDKNDNPHISYIDSITPALNYASYNGISWEIETVDSHGYNICSLALDSNDNPHIICQDTNGNIRYFHYNGSSWETETVDSSGDALALNISLALDSNDVPHISYNHSNGDLKYAYMIPDTDTDSDGDGVEDDADNCPTTPNGPDGGICSAGTIGELCMSHGDCGCEGECSMNQEDTDEDGIGDVCDNCADNCNYDQGDADVDGIGDVCDPDAGCGGCTGPQCETECFP